MILAQPSGGGGSSDDVSRGDGGGGDGCGDHGRLFTVPQYRR